MGFLTRLRKLAPVEVGPWWSARRYVLDKLHELEIQPGDIICRKGNAFVYGLVPFSEFICYLTGSKYSHAALVINVNNDDILVADVNTTGLRRQYITDWCDDIRGDDIAVLRYVGGQSKLIRRLAVENAIQVLNIDPIYDDEFLDNNEGVNWYCVELVCWCYLRAGVLLCDDVPIHQLPNWKKWLNPIATFHGVDYNARVWCVGNEKIGLLSSPHLQVISRIPYVSIKKQSRKHHIFRGA